MIEARSLTKRYKDLTAVDGLDFTVPDGSFFTFVGPNGAGKTTTIRMMCGLTPITSGSLEIAGMSLPDQVTDVKSILGVVPQESSLDRDLTVMENLLIYAGYFGIEKKLARSRAEELIEFVELTTKVDSQPEELSGGMRRRLLIARSLINNPRLLILDEPTTGLDPKVRRSIWDTLQNLTTQGMTLVMSTHYMEEASELSDIVAVMDNGKILSSGPPSELTADYDGSLEKLFLSMTGNEHD